MLDASGGNSRGIETGRLARVQRRQHLEARSRLFEPLTEDLFRRSGLEAGMRVLDVGCGTGDVSLLASRLVGKGGSVVGIDTSMPCLVAAEDRARRAGAKNLAFEYADLDRYTCEPFDAVVGRFVLMQQPDPIASLWRIASYARDGGLLAFQEFDFTHPPLVRPELKLVLDAGRWIGEALRGLGFEIGMGMRLHQAFLSAGLSKPTMYVGAAVESGSDGAVGQLISDTVAELLESICTLGIATADEVDVPTLAARIRLAALETDAVIGTPLVVSSWARVARRPTGALPDKRD